MNDKQENSDQDENEDPPYDPNNPGEDDEGLLLYEEKPPTNCKHNTKKEFELSAACLQKTIKCDLWIGCAICKHKIALNSKFYECMECFEAMKNCSIETADWSWYTKICKDCYNKLGKKDGKKDGKKGKAKRKRRGRSMFHIFVINL